MGKNANIIKYISVKII